MRFYTVCTTLAALFAGATVAYAQSPGTVPVERGTGASVQQQVMLSPAEALESQSRVRVIVQLADPGRSSSSTLGKKDISALQAAVLDSVFGGAPSGRASGDDVLGLTRMTNIPFMAINIDADELEALEADPRVVAVGLDVKAKPHLNQSVKLIGMKAAWDAPYKARGKGYGVAILDTGVNNNHEFLKSSRIVKQACFSGGGSASDSFCPNGQTQQTGGNSGKNCSLSYDDGCSHGTHVAGIATGYNTNRQSDEPKKGVAYKGDIIAVQIFSKDGGDITAWFSDVIAALDWLYDKRKNLGTKLASLNMSIGTSSTFSGSCDGTGSVSGPALFAAIQNLLNKDIATVISSGNSGDVDGVSAPGCISNAVTVGASSKKKSGQPERIAYYSNIGTLVDILAPGGDTSPYPTGTSFTPAILSSVPGNSYAGFQGTSMSAPHIAGVFAAIRSSDGCSGKSVNKILNSLEKKGKEIVDVVHTKVRPNVKKTLKHLGCG